MRETSAQFALAASIQTVAPRLQGRGVAVHARVGRDLHALRAELRADRRRDRPFLRKENRARRLHRRKGQQIGRAGDVVPAQVEQPGDLVQRGQDRRVRALAAHVLPEERELLGRGAARALHGQQEGLRRRARGPAGPDLAHQVAVHAQAHALVGQGRAQVARHGLVDHLAVKAQAAALGQGLGQVFPQGRDAGLPAAQEPESAALDLPRRLDEVAPVRPEDRVLLRHRADSRRARKARAERARLVVLAHVLGLVVVRRGHDVGVDPCLRHVRAQGRQPCIVHLSSLLMRNAAFSVVHYTPPLPAFTKKLRKEWATHRLHIPTPSSCKFACIRVYTGVPLHSGRRRTPPTRYSGSETLCHKFCTGCG